MLSQAELERYQRQLVLPELGVAGQERLKASRVLVVGAGGLGSPVALYLAAAGVGTIGLVDSDRVEASNLHRQILHGVADLGSDKTASAAQAIARLNPAVMVEPHQLRFDAGSAARLVGRYELVVDGCDNYPTRYAINDSCAAAGTPWVYGSVERYVGQVSVFGLPDGPCYRCIFPEPPGASASCDVIGVLGAVPGVVGALQATEALKLLTGIGQPMSGKLLQLDLLRGETSWVRFDKRPDCKGCGRGRRGAEGWRGGGGGGAESEDARGGDARGGDARGEASAGERGTSASPESAPLDIEPAQVSSRLRQAEPVRLIDVRERWEMERAGIAGAAELPMSEIEQHVDTLSTAEELIVFCHHGTRSRMVAEWLRSLGFQARNMAGGIDRWSIEVDPKVPRY